MADANPLAYNPDGTAVDPIAFRDALMADPEKLRAIEADKELAAALLGDDTAKIQDTLKMLFEAQKREGSLKGATGANELAHAPESPEKEYSVDVQSRQAAADLSVKMTSSDILRAQCPVPRDPTVLYENMLKVWIPEEVATQQTAGGGVEA